MYIYNARSQEDNACKNSRMQINTERGTTDQAVRPGIGAKLADHQFWLITRRISLKARACIDTFKTIPSVQMPIKDKSNWLLI